MNYVIVDLEWNQDAEGKHGKKHKKLPFEIIEIGAIKLGEQKNTIGQFNELIKPVVYRNMHYITEKMVHIHMEDLDGSKTFPQVLKKFLKWCGSDYIFCSWGNLDLVELQRNMRYYHLQLLADGPFPFLDVQKLFSIAFEDGKSRRNLEYAVDFLQIEKDIPFHRAFSDAYYTARILEKIDTDIEDYCSYDVCSLPGSRQEEVYKTFSDYSKYISREFEDKEAAIADREVLSTRCYICSRAAKRKVKWFTPNGKHYYSVSYCDRHGYMKGKIRIKKPVFRTNGSESVYVVKTLKMIPEQEVDEIIEKRNHAKEMKHTRRRQVMQKKNKAEKSKT